MTYSNILSIIDSSFVTNVATKTHGGAILCEMQNVNMVFRNNEFLANRAAVAGKKNMLRFIHLTC